MSLMLAYLQPNGATWEAQQRDSNGDPVLDEFAQRTFQAAVPISARIKGSAKLIRTATGEQVPATAQIITTAAIDLGDKVNGREVIAVDPANTLTGGEAYRTVYI